MIDYDATIVERLRDAGAVLVAKLTLGALAQGDVWFGGQTRNPWNPQTGSSGSSAGPGSATAAGCVAFAIGTETRGSILSPSSVNGLAGLRPTYGRVSRYGAMALSTTMDKIGPMCRYVEDAVIVLNTIYGPDKRDGSVADAALHWNPDTAARRVEDRLREDGVRQRRAAAADLAEAAAVGGRPAERLERARRARQREPERARLVPRARRAGRGRGPQMTPEQQAAIAAETKKIYDDVLETYTKLGAKLEPVDVPADLTQMTNAIGFLLEVESAASFDDATRSGDINQLQNPNGSRSSWPNTFRQSRFVPAVEYIRAMRIRTLLQRQADDFFSKFDVLLEPGTGGTLGMTNLTGHPAMAVKCGFTNTPGYATGQPRVLMLTGRLYDEATVARVALAFEQATDWKDKHPTLTT